MTRKQRTQEQLAQATTDAEEWLDGLDPDDPSIAGRISSKSRFHRLTGVDDGGTVYGGDR